MRVNLTEMPDVLIALGSNVGDRRANLQAAIQVLARSVEILSVAPVYETAPMYVVDQAPFYNSALKAQSNLPPLGLLKVLKEAEAEVGRQLGRRYGPREIDIDLIAYGSLRYRNAPTLEVPHHLVAERRFVLQPLFDIAPDAELPGLGKISSLLARTNDQSESVKKVADAFLSLHGDGSKR